MISKEQFVNIIDRLKEANDTVNDVNKILKNTRDNIENDFMNASAMSISHEGIVVKLLENIFEDTEDISYFIYELDYGRNYEPGMIMDENSNCVDMGSAEKLYEYLVKRMEEN